MNRNAASFPGAIPAPQGSRAGSLSPRAVALVAALADASSPAASSPAASSPAESGQRAASPSSDASVVNDRRFTDVFVSEHQALLRLAYLLTDDQPDSEELVQEAFARWYARIESVEDPAAFLRTLILNQARGGYRKKLVRRKRQHLFATNDRAPALSEPDLLLDVLAKLNPRQRAVVVLRFYEGRNEAEIAALIGCRPGTVKSLLSRALQNIRQEVER